MRYKQARDIAVNLVEILGASHASTNIAIVETAAIIWFSVKLEINIPKLMYAIDVIKNPNIVTSTVGISGVLK